MNYLDRIAGVIAGGNSISVLSQEAGKWQSGAGSILLVADPGLRNFGLTDEIESQLKKADLSYSTFEGFKADPTIEQCDIGSEMARQMNASLIVAIGGGSAMDIGKAIACVAADAPSAQHYALAAHPLPQHPKKKVLIPTTSGTGSEMTRTSVLTNRQGVKTWLWGEEMKADLVILDPQLTTSLPPHLTAATAIDALVHAIEACTNANAFAQNDTYCHEAIRLVAKNLEGVLADPDDLEIRGALQWAAALAGIGIDNCGTAIAHNIGHALASLRPIHHGRAVGLAMMASLKWNVEADDGRFARVAELIYPYTGIKELPLAFEKLVHRSGMRVSLREEGYDHITAELLALEMAKAENASMRKSNFRSVSDQDLLFLAHRVMELA